MVFYCTCQCPNFKENFWSPSIYWAKGLRFGQTACQCLHLLLCARHRRFPQEWHSRTAVEGKKYSGINHSLKVCKTAHVHAAKKYFPALSARICFNICTLKKNNELFSEITGKSSSDGLLEFEDVISNLEIILEPSLRGTTREASYLTTATGPVWRTESLLFFWWLCFLPRSHILIFSSECLISDSRGNLHAINNLESFPYPVSMKWKNICPSFPVPLEKNTGFTSKMLNVNM